MKLFKNIFNFAVATMLTIVPCANAGPLGGTEFKIGADGTDSGIVETATWDSLEDVIGWNNIVWDDEVGDGLDSGWVDVEFFYSPGYYYINIGGTITEGFFDDYNTVDAVYIDANVVGSGKYCGFRYLNVKWYYTDSTGPEESWTISTKSTPVASTLTAPAGTSASKSYWSWPDGFGYNEVKITGQIKLQNLAPGVMPSPESIYGQVIPYIFP